MELISVSLKSMTQEFHPCTPEFVKICKCGCEFSTKHGTLITIHNEEVPNITRLGGVVVDGFLQPVEKETPRGRRLACPFLEANGLCQLHGTPNKPFGCVASPFTLNKHRTLVVRNRYRMLKCYKPEKGGMPVYKAHKQSLIAIVGEENWEKIDYEIHARYSWELGKMVVAIPRYVVSAMLDNDAVKRNLKNEIHGK